MNMASASRYGEGAELSSEAGGIALFATDRMEESSSAIQQLAPISKDHAAAWVNYWKSVNYL